MPISTECAFFRSLTYFLMHVFQGFYPGGTAIAFRQATNWASRQGFTEAVRERFKVLFHGDPNAKLTVAEEAWSGIIGGAHYNGRGPGGKDPLHSINQSKLHVRCRGLADAVPFHSILDSTTGALACWNHPFEVARIEMQAAANAGEAPRSMMQVFQGIVKTEGVGGLFKGIVPRIGLGIWQTLFMVTGAKLLKRALAEGKDGKQQ